MPDLSPASTPSFESLFAGVAESAFGIAVRLSGSPTRACELLQAAASSPREPGRLERPGEFRVWLLRALVHCCREAGYPSSTAASGPELDDTPDLYLYTRVRPAGFPADGPDPAASFLDALGSDRVAAGIDYLPAEYRVICTLYFMEDLTYEELATVLECPIGAVRARLQRGRKMLQKALWRIAQEEGMTGGQGDTTDA